MHINDLTEDALMLLFCQFTLQERIRLRLVCPHWNHIISSLCRTKKSLKLFGPYRDADYYQTFVNRYNLYEEVDFSTSRLADESLVVSGRLRTSSHFLANLFPCLERLLLYTDGNQLMIDLEWLLDRWSGSLQSLALFRMECYVRPDSTHTLWTQIVAIPSLRRLHLFELYNTVIPDFRIMLPSLSRLETFSLGDYRSGDIVPVLGQLGPHLNHLRLGPLIQCSLEQFQILLQVNAYLASKLPRLSLSYIQPNRSTTAGSVVNAKQLVRCICANFRKLEYLDIKFGSSIQLADLLFDLVRLHHLATLKLDLGFKLDPQLVPTLPKLTTVRYLHIDICEQLTFRPLLESLAILFPNLDRIHFKCYTADLATATEEISPFMNGMHFRKLKKFTFVPINNHNI